MPRCRRFCSVAAVALIGLGSLAGCGAAGESATPDEDVKSMGAQVQPAAAVGTTVLDKLDQLVAAHDPDPVGALVKAMEAQPDVAGVHRFADAGSILVVLRNGVAFGVSLAEMTSASWQARPRSGLVPAGEAQAGAAARAAALHAASIIVCDPANYPRSKTACVVRAFTGEFHQDVGTISAPLARAGFTVKSYGLASVDDLVKLRSGLQDCGVIHFRTHGVLNEDLAATIGDNTLGEGCDPQHRTKNHCGNHLLTEIPMDGDDVLTRLQAVKSSFGAGVLGKGFGISPHRTPDKKVKMYLSLSPAFFADASYPNTFVYADACSSDEPIPTPPGGDQLKDAFRKKGAGSFLGWSDQVPVAIADGAAAGIFDKLAPQPLGIDSVTLSAPPHQAVGQAYTPVATVSPPKAGIELRLAVSGTDGYATTEARTTDASGTATFTPIPGAVRGVKDTVTVSAGGASDGATVVNVVQNDPTLKQDWSVLAEDPFAPIARLNRDSVPQFNLACNNARLTATQTTVEFGGT